MIRDKQREVNPMGLKQFDGRSSGVFARAFGQPALPMLLAVMLAYSAFAAADIGRVGSAGRGEPWSKPVVDVAARGYVVEEFYLTGEATSYGFSEGYAYNADGKWRTRPVASKPFVTRFLVVRPGHAKDFNGTVVLHWLNVTAGFELGQIDAEHLRGYAWVGVSAQKVGVDGFPGLEANGLKKWDAGRYGRLQHPGDAWSYDIFTQVAKALMPNRTGQIDPLGGLPVDRVIAAGASQSASRIRTYINGVHHHVRVFDGYLPYIDFGGTVDFARDGLPRSERGLPVRTRIRDDLGVPVIVANSETEATFHHPVRQDDSATYRLYEVAGTSHVSVARGAETTFDNPNWHSYQPVFFASLRHLHRWLADGVTPPSAPLIDVALVAGAPTVQRDADGNATGGIRLPDFAVPSASHSGVGKAGGGRFSFLYGVAEDFGDDVLKELYPTSKTFLARWDRALYQSLADGMVLPEDAPALRESAADWAARLDVDKP